MVKARKQISTVRTRILDALKITGYTQEEAGRMIWLSKSRFSKKLNGGDNGITKFTVEEIYWLCNKIDVSAEHIITGNTHTVNYLEKMDAFIYEARRSNNSHLESIRLLKTTAKCSIEIRNELKNLRYELKHSVLPKMVKKFPKKIVKNAL